jgi:hypothetical protein
VGSGDDEHNNFMDKTLHFHWIIKPHVSALVLVHSPHLFYIRAAEYLFLLGIALFVGYFDISIFLTRDGAKLGGYLNG